MRREGKAGPFIPCEVRAQTGSARATTPVVACRHRRVTTIVGAQAKAYLLGRRCLRSGGNACTPARTHARERQCMRLGDNVCARATTGAAWEGYFFTNTPNFSARATTSVSKRQCLHLCDDGCRVGGVFFHKHPKLQRLGNDVCVWATTPAFGRRRLDPFFQTLAFFRALAIQTKLFHYLFLKITETVLKMVIQSYFY